ncbi:PPE domain-containing protein [Mycobacterium sp. DSM 3803]|nr:PPE domain-containing protein [Mycobacterium sp. DSM 3803]
MAVKADPEGLVADGAALSGTAQPVVCGPDCLPAGMDSVSGGVTAHLIAHSQAVSALLTHAGILRGQGGEVTRHTGTVLRATDEAGAETIASGGSSGAPTAAPSPAAVPIPEPVVPPIPILSEPQAAPGELWAVQIHGGPGSSSWRAMATSLRSQAGDIDRLAADTRHSGSSINANWVDDGQQAGANTVAHADWLTGMAEHTRQLADTADAAADHFDQAREATPRPEVFTELRARLQQARSENVAYGGLLSGRVATLEQQLADKEAEAVGAGNTYFAAAATTTGGTPTPPHPAPPIARGDGPKPKPEAGPKKPAEPAGKPPKDTHGVDDGPATGGEKPKTDGPGQSPMTAADTADTAGPPPPAPTPDEPAASPPSMPAVDTTAPGTAANIAGTIVGAVVGAGSQLAGSGAGLPNASSLGAPLNALSGLSSLPGMGGGGPSMPELPSDLGTGGEPDLGLGDEGFGDTAPADAGAGGSGGGAPPVSPAAPTMAPSTGATPMALPATTGGVPAGGGAPASGGMGMGGMYPPMMGPRAGQNDERDKDRDPDKRVVVRPVPNSEPVFGELERKRRPRRSTQQKGNADEGNSEARG